MIFDPTYFPLNDTPLIFREAIFDAQQINQSATPILAVAMLSAASLACQHRGRVRLPTGKRSPIALMTLVSVKSGAGKSPADEAANRAGSAADINAHNEFLDKSKKFKDRHTVWLDELNLLKKSSKAYTADQFRKELADLREREPKPPKKRRLVYKNISIPALISLLAAHGESAALISDEASTQLFGSTMRDPATLSNMWDGAPIYFDRKDESVLIKSVALTISWKIQPGELDRYMDLKGKQMRDSGFLARILFCAPVSTQGHRQVSEVPPILSGGLVRFESRASELFAETDERWQDDINAKPDIEMSPEAKLLWITFANAVELDQQPGRYLSDVPDAASKIADNCGRIAAIFHIYCGHDGLISGETMHCAIQVSSWFLIQFKNTFGMTLPRDRIDAMTLVQWLSTRPASVDGIIYFPRGKLIQWGPTALRDRPRLNAALAFLESNGMITVGPIGRTIVVTLVTTRMPPMPGGFGSPGTDFSNF
jgi:hypothetical protein